jgi:hypothetical protein
MTACWICKNETSDGSNRILVSGDIRINVHPSCLAEFGLVVREALAAAGRSAPVGGMERIARNVEGDIVLVHRQFPNDQLPILVYLAHFDGPIPVLEIYSWLRQNELKISNPSLALLRLSGKGLVTTLKRDDQRFGLITEAGRRVVDEYADSIA